MNKKTIAEMKRMKDINIPDAIELLKNGIPEYYTENASLIRGVRDAFKLVRIAYSIVPDYKW